MLAPRATGQSAEPVRFTPQSMASVAMLHDMVASVSAERIKQDVTQLVGFGTRHTLSETASETRGIGAARRWIEAEFQRTSAACGD